MTPMVTPRPVSPTLRQVFSTRVSWAALALLTVCRGIGVILATSERRAIALIAASSARMPMPGTALATSKIFRAPESLPCAVASTRSAVRPTAARRPRAAASRLARATTRPAASAAPVPVNWTKTLVRPRDSLPKGPRIFRAAARSARRWWAAGLSAATGPGRAGWWSGAAWTGAATAASPPAVASAAPAARSRDLDGTRYKGTTRHLRDDETALAVDARRVCATRNRKRRNGNPGVPTDGTVGTVDMQKVVPDPAPPSPPSPPSPLGSGYVGPPRRVRSPERALLPDPGPTRGRLACRSRGPDRGRRARSRDRRATPRRPPRRAIGTAESAAQEGIPSAHDSNGCQGRSQT